MPHRRLFVFAFLITLLISASWIAAQPAAPVIISLATPVSGLVEAGLPVAHIRDYPPLLDTDNQPGEAVLLDGSTSVDTNGTLVRYDWSVNGVALGINALLLLHSFPEGTHTVALTVTDNDGYQASTSTQLTIGAYYFPADCAHEMGLWASNPPPNIPNAHQEGAIAVVGDQLYLLGGYNAFAKSLLVTANQVDMFDSLSGTWLTSGSLAPVPALLTHVQAAADGRFIWLAGGFDDQNPGQPVNKVYRYDTLTNTWAEGPSLPEPRASGGVVRVGRTLHYIGGLLSRTQDALTHWTLDLDRVEGSDPAVLDGSVTWQAAPPLPTGRGRNHFQAVALGQNIYIMGGQIGHDGGNTDTNMADVYNTATATWKQLPDLPGPPRSHAEVSTFVLDERIIVAGGTSTKDAPVTTILEFNPRTNTWATLANLPPGSYNAQLYGPYVAALNGKVYITAGGQTRYNNLKTVSWAGSITINCPNGIPPTLTPTLTSTPTVTASATLTPTLTTTLTLTPTATLSPTTTTTGPTRPATTVTQIPEGLPTLTLTPMFTIPPRPTFAPIVRPTGLPLTPCLPINQKAEIGHPCQL